MYSDHQISIDWAVDEVFDFLFFDPFFFNFCLGFSTGGGWVFSRCFWMAANGSIWNTALFRTVLNCLVSFSLIQMKSSNRMNTTKKKKMANSKLSHLLTQVSASICNQASSWSRQLVDWDSSPRVGIRWARWDHMLSISFVGAVVFSSKITESFYQWVILCICLAYHKIMTQISS